MKADQQQRRNSAAPANPISNWQSGSPAARGTEISAELGDKLGVSFQQVQKYEKGVNRVSALPSSAIATALDVPVTFFTTATGREVEPALPGQRVQPEAAARLQQDQGPDRTASAGVLDGIDRRQRGLGIIAPGSQHRGPDQSTREIAG
jgi:transcriptional regulator with XRE-family HTH domain